MITADLILPNLHATSKKQVLRALAEETAGLLRADPDDLLTALLDRERIGSTGIGNGVAIPHVKLESADKIYSILARLDTAIDYDAIDGRPVDIIFMLLAPVNSKTTQHLKTLAHISRFLKDQKTCRDIRSTMDQSQIAELLADWVKAQAAA